MLFDEKFKLLPEQDAWSVGFAAGESHRRGGKWPSRYVMIGIDEYCRGFRDGYFERGTARLFRPGGTSLPHLLK